jgi:hypothetical protein
MNLGRWIRVICLPRRMLSIFLKNTGCVGTITVSGLPQREDHCLVVETVASYNRISQTSPSRTRPRKHCRRGISRTPRRQLFPPLSIPLPTLTGNCSKSEN